MGPLIDVNSLNSLCKFNLPFNNDNNIINDFNNFNIIGKNQPLDNYEEYYEEDYGTYEYEEEYQQPIKKKSTLNNLHQQFLSFIELFRNHKQLGASLLGLGLLLTFLGMMFFFEATLLRIGNICIIVGIPLLVGPDSVRQFFLKQSRTQATVIVSIGILLVLWGKPRLGILFEIFGILNMFGNMNPLVLALIKKMPVIGDMISAFEGKENKKQSNDRYKPKARGAPRNQKRYSPDF